MKPILNKEKRSVPDNGIGHEDIASSSELFVTADEVEATDWGTRLNGLSQVVAENRKIPMYERRMKFIIESVQHSDGIKRHEVLEEGGPLGMKRNFLYTCVKKLEDDGVLYRDSGGGLHTTGVPMPCSEEWKAHNIRIKFTKPMGGMTLQALCDFLKKNYLDQEDEAKINPTNWKELGAEKLHEIMISCTNNPKNSNKLLKIQKGIEEFFGHLPKFRIRAELNRDIPLTGKERVWTGYLRMSYLEKNMKVYRKTIKGKEYLRAEKIMKCESMSEMIDCMRNEITIDYLTSQMHHYRILFEEERHQHEKTLLQLSQKNQEIKNLSNKIKEFEGAKATQSTKP